MNACFSPIIVAADPLVEHWEAKYGSDPTAGSFSWTQARPNLDLELVSKGMGNRTPSDMVFFDAGGGASQLSELVQTELGIGKCIVMDLSSKAMALAAKRAQKAGANIEYLHGNILDADLADGSIDVWHDRAVLHFLVDDADVQTYIDKASRAIAPGGALIIGAFDADGGPKKCSGLPVRQWSARGLERAFNRNFILQHYEHEVHKTPGGSSQKFVFVVLRRKPF